MARAKKLNVNSNTASKPSTVNKILDPQIELQRIFGWAEGVTVSLLHLQQGMIKLDDTKIITNAQLDVLNDQMRSCMEELVSMRADIKNLQRLTGDFLKPPPTVIKK